MGLHKYQGNNFSPNGHKYIREFDCEHIPATTYRVGGVILRKEKIFVHHENRILIRYTLLDAHSATTLRFRPFLAFRSVREYTHENAQASREYQLVENGIRTCMYPGYPELYMQLNKKCEFHFLPDWYRGIEYPKEQERGYDFNEDLYVPGYFEVDIKKGESIVFSAGTSEISPRRLKQTFEAEVADRTPRDSFYHCLKNSAHQYHNQQEGEHYILAGYPWFKCRTGTAGRAALLISGGIDSPVAGYLMAKRGLELSAVHFYSYPYTSERARDKVVDLTGLVARYSGPIRLHLVPFTEIQLAIYEQCPPKETTVLMRRLMMKIAERWAREDGALALITGEALGQVASQTLESLCVTDDAVDMPVFRPLIGFDKDDIIDIAKKINTFNTSILPYEDCCTVFVPQHPVTKPKVEDLRSSEAMVDFEGMIQKAMADTETLIVTQSGSEKAEA